MLAPIGSDAPSPKRTTRIDRVCHTHIASWPSWLAVALVNIRVQLVESPDIDAGGPRLPGSPARFVSISKIILAEQPPELGAASSTTGEAQMVGTEGDGVEL